MSSVSLSPQPLCAQRKMRIRQKLLLRIKVFFAGLNSPRDYFWRLRPISSRLSKTTLFDSVEHAQRSIAIYAHFNSHSRVSEMVLKQLQEIHSAGFETILVSMSPIESKDELEKLRPLVRKVVIRKSFGRDFGAWHDIIQTNQSLIRGAKEILLVNDSLLGPFRSMAPLFNSMRLSGDGLFGLTDSPDYHPHLQSYFLLFRGRSSIDTLLQFMSRLKLSFNKTSMIQRGELGLARFFAANKIPMRALFPYDEIREKAVQENEYLETILACLPNLMDPSDLSYSVLGAEFKMSRFVRMRIKFKLLGVALNPTHFYWRVLINEFGYPFIKANLVVENEARIPDITSWRDVIPQDGPVGSMIVERHLGID